MSDPVLPGSVCSYGDHHLDLDLVHPSPHISCLQGTEQVSMVSSGVLFLSLGSVHQPRSPENSQASLLMESLPLPHLGNQYLSFLAWLPKMGWWLHCVATCPHCRAGFWPFVASTQLFLLPVCVRQRQRDRKRPRQRDRHRQTEEREGRETERYRHREEDRETEKKGRGR
jgi:hypothetical protein